MKLRIYLALFSAVLFNLSPVDAGQSKKGTVSYPIINCRGFFKQFYSPAPTSLNAQTSDAPARAQPHSTPTPTPYKASNVKQKAPQRITNDILLTQPVVQKAPSPPTPLPGYYYDAERDYQVPLGYVYDRQEKKYVWAGKGPAPADAPYVSMIVRPSEFIAKVVGVSDGDTLTVLRLQRSVKVRLYGVDCPEKNQAFGQRAKQFTSSQVFGKFVKVRIVGFDHYGRSIALVHQPNGGLLNAHLVNAGFAWYYRQYAPNEPILAQMEMQAKAGKRGLWIDAHPVAPWEFRRKK